MITTLANSRIEPVQEKFNLLVEKWTLTSSSLENQIGRLEALFKCGFFVINQSNVNTLRDLKRSVTKLQNHLKEHITIIKANLRHPLYNGDLELESANLKLSSEIEKLVAKTYSFKRLIFGTKDHFKKLF